jgi:sigma-E factor negative regulatory protein RseB
MYALRERLAASILLGCATLLASPAGLADADMAPNDWLAKMGSAVRGTNYEGTVIRNRNGKSEVLKVVHAIEDGVVRERVIVQEGNGLEIVRVGNEVQCILPDEQSVLVEEWNDQSALFSTLPSSDIQFGSEYDVSIVRSERVAGRKAVLLAVRPHDEYRFGHRLWLDIETGFPLQTKLIDDAGAAVDHVKFADIRLDADIDSSALAPSTSTENFRWFTSPKRAITHDVPTSWNCDDLPSGFRAISAHQETLDEGTEPLTHILYSDGLATVSVFIESASGKMPSSHSRVGTSNSFSLQIDGYQVTAVGEVPAATVKRMASSMRRN